MPRYCWRRYISGITYKICYWRTRMGNNSIYYLWSILQVSKELGEPQKSGFSLVSLNQVRGMCRNIFVNYAATLFVTKSSVRMECAKKVLTSASSAFLDSHTPVPHHYRIRFEIIWWFWLVECRPELSSLSNDVGQLYTGFSPPSSMWRP